MHSALIERLGKVIPPTVGIVLICDLIIVVGTGMVGVNSLAYGKIVFFALEVAEIGAKGHSVDARAAVYVHFAVLCGSVVVVNDRFEVNGTHNAVVFCVHIHSVDLINVENCDIERVLQALVAHAEGL